MLPTSYHCQTLRLLQRNINATGHTWSRGLASLPSVTTGKFNNSQTRSYSLFPVKSLVPKSINLPTKLQYLIPGIRSSSGSQARKFNASAAMAQAGMTTPDSDSSSTILNQASSTESPFVKPGWEVAISTWIFGVAGMCFGMILIGGYTRLSGSGLSMTSWKFQGTMLPCTKNEWDRQFDIYKTTPEYKKLHASTMDMDEFKQIYFVEWFHRMWGRATGLFFALPGLVFAANKAIKPKLAIQMAVLLSLGVSQAFVGWWMVRSGFVEPKEHMPLSNNEAPRVSAYRLTTHLAAALTIYGGLIWTGMQVITPQNLISKKSLLNGIVPINTANRTLKLGLMGVTTLVTTTILSGGFVAGNDAGCAYNTWPQMKDDNNEWIPDDVRKSYSLTTGSPRMFFEDTATVQFNHRMLSYSSALSAFGLAGYVWSKGGVNRLDPFAARIVGRYLPVMVIGQVSLGIMTLLNAVPTSYGVAHQGMGVGVLTTLLLALAKLRGC